MRGRIVRIQPVWRNQTHRGIISGDTGLTKEIGKHCQETKNTDHKEKEG